MGTSLVAAAAVVALFVGGCSDGAPSKKTFLAKADAACKPRTDAALGVTTPGDFVSLRHFHFTLAEGIDKTVAAVEALDVPAGADGEAARSWVASLKGAGAAARQVVRDVDVANYAAVEIGATKLAEAVRAADSQARALGSTECARGENDAVTRMANALPKALKDAVTRAVVEVCRNAEIGTERQGRPKSLPEYQARLEEATARQAKAVAGVKALAAPSTDKALLDEFVAAVEKVIAHHNATAAAITADQFDFAMYDTSTELVTKAESAARAFGVPHCTWIL